MQKNAQSSQLYKNNIEFHLIPKIIGLIRYILLYNVRQFLKEISLLLLLLW